jgi:hypothetical protein
VKQHDIIIEKVNQEFQVVRSSIPAQIKLKNLNLGISNFNNVECSIANRPRSNQVLVAVKDGIGHLIAKDPDISLLIKNGQGLDFDSFSRTSTGDFLIQEKKSIFNSVQQIFPKETKQSEFKLPDAVDVKKEIEQKVQKKIIESSSEQSSLHTAAEQMEFIKKMITYTIKSEIQHASLIVGGAGLGKCLSGEEEIEIETTSDFFNFLTNLKYE